MVGLILAYKTVWQKLKHQTFSYYLLVKVIRKLAAYDLTNELAVHVALDNTIVIDDAKGAAANSDKKLWRPLLLVVPLRLGLTDINPIYFADLKVMFAFCSQSHKQSIQIIICPFWSCVSASTK